MNSYEELRITLRLSGPELRIIEDLVVAEVGDRRDAYIQMNNSMAGLDPDSGEYAASQCSLLELGEEKRTIEALAMKLFGETLT